MIPPLSLEAQIERLSFEPEPSLAWVGQDCVAVPDVRSGRVILFDSSGQEVEIIGRFGNAPGEFGQPLRVFGTRDGGLIVADLQPPRLTYLSVEGPSALQTASPIPGVPLQILGGDGSGATLAWLEQSQMPVAVVIGNADFQTGDIAARSRIPLPQQSTAVIPAVVMDSSGLIHVGYGTRDQIQSFGDDGSVLGTRGFVDRPPVLIR